MQDSPAIVCYLKWACLFCETTTGGISYTDCGSCLMSGNCAKDIRLATSCSSVSRVGPLMCVSAREANPPRKPHCALRGGRPQWIFTNRDRSRFEGPPAWRNQGQGERRSGMIPNRIPGRSRTGFRDEGDDRTPVSPERHARKPESPSLWGRSTLGDFARVIPRSPCLRRLVVRNDGKDSIRDCVRI